MLKLRRIFADKLHSDMAWNVGSLAILGVSGIALNILIVGVYSADVLGVFNQVYAVYIFASQFASAGMHLSVLKYAAEHVGNASMGPIIGSAVVLTTGTSLLSSGAFWLASDMIAGWLQSPGVAVGMVYATPGLFLFALNKVLLSILNAERRMKLYAVLQALRPLGFVTVVIVGVKQGLDGDKVAVMFSVSEGVLFLCLAWSHRRRVGELFRPSRKWMCKHLSFGSRSLFSGVLSELNTRVDVLLLGFITSDTVVGIYTFGATLAEGFFQLLIVLRTNFNPLLIRLLSAGGDREELQRFVAKWKSLSYLGLVPVGLIAIAAYPLGLFLLEWIGMKNAPRESWQVFSILMGGILIGSGYLVFFNLLLNAGHPGKHTLMTALVVLSNVIGNIILIPIWGANGAALATAISFVFGALAIAVLSRRIVSVAL